MFRLMTLIETGHETDHVWSDLFHSLITVTTAGLPLLIIPPTLAVATVRACVHGHCCQVRHETHHRVSEEETPIIPYLNCVISGGYLPNLGAYFLRSNQKCWDNKLDKQILKLP